MTSPGASDAATAEPEWWTRLRADWGLDFRQAERVLQALTAGPTTLSELVRTTALDRRLVQQVLHELGPALVEGTDQVLRLGPVPTPNTGVRSRVDLRARLAAVRALLPPDRADLDHVSATVETMAARAEYFADQYDLVGRTVLCVGDHDLTSVALTLLEPTCRTLVVDVDQGVLAVLDRARRELGLDLTVAHADLRLGLPKRYVGAADLAFTDPPYSPEGIGLFLARCLEGLADTGHERVAFAYGFARSQVSRGFQTQDAVHTLKLVYEAVLPGFNRFDGAEAIGTASELYVCRPTRWSRPAAGSAISSLGRIYTRGAAAEEAVVEPLPDDLVVVVDRVAGAAGASAPAPERSDRRVQVGEDWPRGRRLGGDAMTLTRYLTEPTGSERQRRARQSATVNLTPYFDASLGTVLLAGLCWHDVTVVAGRSAREVLDPARPLRRLLDQVADVALTGHGRSFVVVGLRRREPAGEIDEIGKIGEAGQVLRQILLRPHATIRNAWREALIGLAQQQGTTLSKRGAVERIEDAVPDPAFLALRVVDLAEPDLTALLAGVATGVRAG